MLRILTGFFDHCKLIELQSKQCRFKMDKVTSVNIVQKPQTKSKRQIKTHQKIYHYVN